MRHIVRFNPHPLFPADATCGGPPTTSTRCVSILIRCFQRMQRIYIYIYRRDIAVSILIRCFQRMQLQDQRQDGHALGFQSSSAVSSGCNTGPGVGPEVGPEFQSSSAVSSGCNELPADASPEDDDVFQSSSAVSSGCNRRVNERLRNPDRRFNPHPLFPADATELA